MQVRIEKNAGEKLARFYKCSDDILALNCHWNVLGQQLLNGRHMKRVALAVFDLDNTLYDWYAAFVPAFYAMVDTATGILNCEREQLLDELKVVHVKHQDVEHPFGLFETQVAQALVKKLGSDAVWEKLDPAFHAYNRVRKRELRLFPHTLETLTELRARHIKLIAYTDSKYHSALGARSTPRSRRLLSKNLLQRKGSWRDARQAIG